MQAGITFGPYRVEELVGRGGMAEVYKVWHNNLHRFEALKLLPAHVAQDTTFVRRFLDEARVAAGLHHPHIVTIHAVSEGDGPPYYFSMQFVEGGDLADLINARCRVPLRDALPILRQIAAALDYAHRHGVIHRDVKPANILLDSDDPHAMHHGAGEHPLQVWNVKVVDFGIARAMGDGGATRLTHSGMFVGTPEYMSPEQAGSGAAVDQHTDLYSLGVIAYEMLCGRPPFRTSKDTSPLSVVIKHLNDAPPLPSEFNPQLTPAICEVLMRALAKNPADRFSSGTTFVEALAATAQDVAETPFADLPLAESQTPPLEALAERTAEVPRRPSTLNRSLHSLFNEEEAATPVSAFQFPNAEIADGKTGTASVQVEESLLENRGLKSEFLTEESAATNRSAPTISGSVDSPQPQATPATEPIAPLENIERRIENNDRRATKTKSSRAGVLVGLATFFGIALIAFGWMRSQQPDPDSQVAIKPTPTKEPANQPALQQPSQPPIAASAPPVVEIVSPPDASTFAPRKIRAANGQARDTKVKVAGVTVRLWREQDGADSYWAGNAWKRGEVGSVGLLKSDVENSARFDASAAKWQWPLPTLSSGAYRLRVTAKNSSGESSSDEAAFRIAEEKPLTTPSPKVAVTKASAATAPILKSTTPPKRVSANRSSTASAAPRRTTSRIRLRRAPTRRVRVRRAPVASVTRRPRRATARRVARRPRRPSSGSRPSSIVAPPRPSSSVPRPD